MKIGTITGAYRDVGESTLWVADPFVIISSTALTAQVSGETLFQNNSNYIKARDLTHMKAVRIVTRVTTGSTSVNNPRLRVRYLAGTFSSTVGSYSDIGTSEVATSLTSVGYIKSNWIPLATGAKADVWVALTAIGGDGAQSPVPAAVEVQYRDWL